MRAVVTGGAGFLGSALCEALLIRGDTVVCVDNLLTGRLENIEGMLGHSRFTFMEHDVTASLAVPGAVNVVAHLASPASPDDYEQFPLETLAAGSRGTENTLILAEKKNARFLLASTSEVYGDAEIHPQREDYWGNVSPIGPRSVYDEAKRFAEATAMAYGRSRGVNVGIVRIFNTFGPRMRARDGRVVSSLIAQALNGHPLTIYGDGSQTRSFCYVDDLVRGLLAMLESTEKGPINLGNPEEKTIMELARLILDLTGSRSGTAHYGVPIDEPVRRCPDITLASQFLDWKPQVSTEEGLLRTIDYFLSRPTELATAASAIAGARPTTDPGT
jgi:dTDP-glucose 4,6-dehydratase